MLVGEVLKLFISQKGVENRIEDSQLYFDIGGIKEDKFFSKDKDREVLLASTDSYTLAKNNNINLEIGQLGENILIDFNPYSLEIGQQIKISDVIFEISLHCPVCNHLTKVENSLPKLLKKDRGIFARVIQKGNINVGDKIYLI